jgi:hypothetical protein
MPHPFEVGKTYRNRVGEYVVLSIDGNQMKIRYVSGGTLVTDVNLQGRIWENIQLEEQQSRVDERRRQALEARAAARVKTREARAKPAFAGFQEADFQAKKRGVAWANRKALGKVLAVELSQRTKHPFDQWLVPYQATVHVARKDGYDPEAAGRNAAFFVAASERGISYGFWVGKPEGEVQPRWPWPVWLGALAGNQAVRAAVWAAMRTHGEGLDVYTMQVSYGLTARVTAQENGFLWREEGALDGVDRPMDWEGLVEALRTLAPGKRCGLHLCKGLSVEESLKAGSGIAGEIAQMFLALLPIYEASIAR